MGYMYHWVRTPTLKKRGEIQGGNGADLSYCLFIEAVQKVIDGSNYCFILKFEIKLI